ncbi:MAG: hypothetical protein EOP04_00125 [Proteobacteria bacterium]|nr:MAG: hypothetical protein EOP04_00125 [Pseudomonadota bacterium]
MKANTSKHRTITVDKLDRATGHIKAELAKLRADFEEIDDDNEEANRIPKELRNPEIRLQRIREAKDRVEREANEKSQKINPKTQVSLNDPAAQSLGSGNSKLLFIS